MADHVHSGTSSKSGGGSPFRLYKPGQGIHIRWVTAAGAGVLALSCAHFIYQEIRRFAFADDVTIRTLVPVIALAGLGYLIFWLVGRKQDVVDFLIATEGEMKKVNWSTRREVWGATRVVIVAVLALSLILFLVNTIFMILFSMMGVLKVDIVGKFLGGEAGG